MKLNESKKIFVYNLTPEKGDVNPQEDKQVKVVKWMPGITRFIPPNSPSIYLSFWVAHFLNIFKNREYCAYAIYKEEQPICSLVCVPAMYRWSFMEPGDLQIKNVYTREKYRGRGYAYFLIQYAIRDMVKEGKEMVFWYMTDENNVPSQKLCKKAGFRYVGEYSRTRNKLFLYKGKILPVEGRIEG